MISPRNFQPYWLRERMEHVAVVGYPIAAWAHAPNRLDVVGGSVRLQRFVSDDAETLVIIGEHGHALSLFVIPPARRPTGTDVAARRSPFIRRRTCHGKHGGAVQRSVAR
jgi:hypothetical protein